MNHGSPSLNNSQPASEVHTQDLSYNMSVEIPEIQADSLTASPIVKVTNRGRPNKYVVLETGEIIKRLPEQDETEDVPSKLSGKRRKSNKITEHTLVKTTKNSDLAKRNSKKKRGGGRRIIESSDSENSTSPVLNLPRPSSSRAQSLRRNVTKNKKYDNYEVEDLPDRLLNIVNENDTGNDASVNTAQTCVSYQENTIENEPHRKTSISSKGRGRKRRCNKNGSISKSNSPIPESAEDPMNETSTRNENNDPVTCGACETEMPRFTYMLHQYNEHNGLSWIVGEQKPIDFRDTTIENQNFLSNLIREALAKKGKKIGGKLGGHKIGQCLSCVICGHRTYSAAGYLSHIRFCGVTAEERELRMFKCETCGRVMMPSSRYSHENSHKLHAAPKETDAENSASNTSSVRTPRKAAVKAGHFMQEVLWNNDGDAPSKCGFKKVDETRKGIKVMQDTWLKQLLEYGVVKCRYPNCEFTSQDAAVMSDHCQEKCPMRPSAVFKCLHCSVRCSSEADIVKHIKETHPKEDSEEVESDLEIDEISNGEGKKGQRSRVSIKVVMENQGSPLNTPHTLHFLSSVYTYRNKVPYRPALQWMLEWHAERSTISVSFKNLLNVKNSNLQKVSTECFDFYKPEEIYSLPFCVTQKDYEDIPNEECKWRTLQIFAGHLQDHVPMFFTGGPVTAVAWCPTPPFMNNQEQLLSVTCHPSMDSIPSISVVNKQQGMIQIWSLGNLINSRSCAQIPRFTMGLCHNWGTIRQLVWCPAGCWLSTEQIYGLLAAACADGTVRLVPVHRKCENQLFKNAEATLTLLPYSLIHHDSPCLRIAWHIGKSYDVIAGGFADGLVCLWKISSHSRLLRYCVDSEELLLPYLRFQPHSGPITALELSPFESGEPRFISTGSLADKNLTFWDLENLGEVSLGNILRKSRVTSSAWMTCWPNPISGSEDPHQGVLVTCIRNFARNFMILPQNSATLSIDKSDWLNAVVQSTAAGELTLTLLTSNIFGMDNDKCYKDKRALQTCTRSAVLAPNSSNVSCYKYAQVSHIGLIFTDVTLDSDSPWCPNSTSAQQMETMDTVTCINYPLTAINKVAWNPNWQSFGWIAAGYQCGIVRVFFVKCDASDNLVKAYQGRYESTKS